MKTHNLLLIVPVLPGNTFTAPPSMCSRGVFDVLGNFEAHVEIDPTLPARVYVIQEAHPGGPTPALGFYLGHVAGQYGTDIRHLYAVEVSNAG